MQKVIANFAIVISKFAILIPKFAIVISNLAITYLKNKKSTQDAKVLIFVLTLQH